jgi:hypothetical protein
MCKYTHEDISQCDAESDILAQQDIQTEVWKYLCNSELYYINCLTALLGYSRERR